MEPIAKAVRNPDKDKFGAFVPIKKGEKTQ